MTFQVGDRVRLTGPEWDTLSDTHIGMIVEVNRVRGTLAYFNRPSRPSGQYSISDEQGADWAGELESRPGEPAVVRTPLSPRVGSRVRLTGRLWAEPTGTPRDNDPQRGSIITLDRVLSERSGRFRDGTGTVWSVDLVPADGSNWAGELVNEAPGELEPGTVFNLGMAAVQAGILNVTELQAALRWYVLRDRVESAQASIEEARNLLRSMR